MSATGCPAFIESGQNPNLPQEACYNGLESNGDDTVRFGFQLDQGPNFTFTRGLQHTTDFKYIIGHEFGHFVHRKRTGRTLFQFNTDNPQTTQFECASIGQAETRNNPLCNCDLIKSGNRCHCLQSRELQDVALAEGFAHFYSTSIGNGPNSSTCKFGYYKDYISQFNIPHSEPPPVAVTCTGTSTKYMETNCLDGSNQLGVEWDWMIFFYDLRRLSSPIPITDIAPSGPNSAGYERIQRLACGDASQNCCATCGNVQGPTVFFNQPGSPGTFSLVQAANALAGNGQLSQTQANELFNKGQARGINH